MSILHFPSIRVRPVRLTAAAVAIAARWTDGPDIPVQPDDPELRRRLRSLVLSTPPGSHISRRKVRFIVAMVLDPAEAASWRNHAIAVLLALPTPLNTPMLYRLYQDYYTHGVLRQQLLEAHRGGRGPLGLSMSQAAVIFSADPPGAVAQFLRANSRGLGSFHVELGLDPVRPLTRAIVAQLFKSGDQAWLRSQTAVDVRSALTVHLHQRETWSAFLTLLVRAHDAQSWKLTKVGDHQVISAAFTLVTTDRFLGRPDERPQHWTKVAPDVTALVRRWLLQRQVEGFFEKVDATPDRRIFWRRAASVIEEIHNYPACKAFAMRIGPIWFVEFGDVGNACYPYELHDYEVVRATYEAAGDHRRSYPSMLKSVLQTFHPPFSDLQVGQRSYSLRQRTLPHVPAYGRWHERFEAYIRVFCNATMD